MNYSRVQPGDWKTVYCVAGGPSLAGFEMARLKGSNVIAVNDAVLHLPFASANFSCDRNWTHRRISSLHWFTGEKYMATGLMVEDDTVHNLIRKRDDGLSEDPTAVHIASSGYGALNLAFLKGAKEIFLLGYDYRQGGTHWYPERGTFGSNGLGFPQWARKYLTTLPQLQSAGVRVWNASRDSLITAFPKISLEEIQPTQKGKTNETF